MSQNIRQKDFNKNVIQVYTQEPGFTGYKGFEFNAIDELESILRTEIAPQLELIKGNLESGININQIDLDADADQVDLGGSSLLYLSGIEDLVRNGGININQIDLNWEADTVALGGEISGAIQQAFVTGENIPPGFTVYQANLDREFDNVSSYPEKSHTISNYTTSGNVNGIVLAANRGRRELYVQNLATGNLYIKYGSGANNLSFNFVLAANSEENAGNGGSLSDQSYTGIVSVSGLASRYISWERS
ncbi:MAG: hypothetical protein EBU90_22785 [Proteobacteria bacterium]|nr:hypothetical protein [Pseudomonadota bacterium]